MRAAINNRPKPEGEEAENLFLRTIEELLQ
jgi:hypothetical protein